MEKEYEGKFCVEEGGDEVLAGQSSSRREKQMDFILEIDKSKNVFRQTYLADGNRKENDAEHSWHLAVMAFLLAEYANEPVDVLKVMKMVLVHDLVEIDAGDTYAYDTSGNGTKREREMAGARRLFSILPQDQEKMLWDLWDEFENGQSAEAKFARTLDHCQPVLLNDASGGRSWREHHVCKSQIYGRNIHTHEGSEAVWGYVKDIIDKNIDNGNIMKE